MMIGKPVVHSCGHHGLLKASPLRQPPSMMKKLEAWMASNPCPKCFLASCKAKKPAFAV